MIETASTEPQAEQADQTRKITGLRRYLDPVMLAAVILFSLAIRLYDLGSFPDTLLADEADNAQDSLRITYGLTPVNGLFGFDWTAQPAFSAYLLSAFIKLFGFTMAAIRLPSAVIGTLALIPFYLLLRRQFSMSTSLLTTLLLATNVWYLNFSRSGWNNVHICFYMLMAMLFLMLALDTLRIPARGPAQQRWLRWFYFGAAGFFCALGLYGYPSGRAVILGIMAFFPVALWFYRRHWRQLVAGYIIAILTAGIIFAPQGAYILQNWEAFNGRSKVVTLMNSPDYQSDPAGTLWLQLSKNVRGPWDGSVNNTAQYSPVGEPQLETITGLLVLVGMALSLLLPGLRRRPENWLWWLMLLVAWISTQVLTVGTPNGARGIGYMPTLLYFAAVAVEIPIRAASRLPRPARWVPAVVTAIVLLAVGYGNVTHYIDWQSQPRTRQDRNLYIAAYEFPEWSSDVIERARTKQVNANVGVWRDAHPLKDLGNPQPPSDIAPDQPVPTPAAPTATSTPNR